MYENRPQTLGSPDIGRSPPSPKRTHTEAIVGEMQALLHRACEIREKLNHVHSRQIGQVEDVPPPGGPTPQLPENAPFVPKVLDLIRTLDNVLAEVSRATNGLMQL